MSPKAAPKAPAKGNRTDSSTYAKITASKPTSTPTNVSATVTPLSKKAYLSKQSTKSVNKTPATKAKTPDEDILLILKKTNSPRFFYDLNAPPYFSTLFPEVTVPSFQRLSNQKISVQKNEFNPLFLSRLSAAKKFLKEKAVSTSRLPSEFTSHTRDLILASIAKTSSKQTSSTSTSSGHKKPSPGTKSSDAVPVPTTQEVKPTSKSKDPTDILRESKNPQFYFSPDKVPSFPELFPGTTIPKYVRRSGNIFIDPEAFSPLLRSRLASAHKALHKASVTLQRLPSPFVKYQVRLITNSIQVHIQSKKDKKTAKKKAQAEKRKAASKAKTVSFVPSKDTPEEKETPTRSSSAPPVPTSSQKDSSDTFTDFHRDNRLLRALLSASLAEINLYNEHDVEDLQALPCILPQLPSLQQHVKENGYKNVKVLTPSLTKKKGQTPGTYVSVVLFDCSTTSTPSGTFGFRVPTSQISSFATFVSARTDLAYNEALTRFSPNQLLN